MRLHGVSVSIILVRGAQFTSKFLKIFQEIFGFKGELNQCFSSSDEWTSRAYYFDLRRYVERLCDWLERELG